MELNPLLVISGNEARDIKSDVRGMVDMTSTWREIRQMDVCQYGCKMHVRRRGCVNEFALIHYSGYGCKLGRSAATRIVKVKVA